MVWALVKGQPHHRPHGQLRVFTGGHISPRPVKCQHSQVKMENVRCVWGNSLHDNDAQSYCQKRNNETGENATFQKSPDEHIIALCDVICGHEIVNWGHDLKFYFRCHVWEFASCRISNENIIEHSGNQAKRFILIILTRIFLDDCTKIFMNCLINSAKCLLHCTHAPLFIIPRCSFDVSDVV